MVDRSRKLELALVEEQEPLGIIISRGSRLEDAPRFSAYVWGPVDETPPAEAPKPLS